jgi:hypothetical protein
MWRGGVANGGRDGAPISPGQASGPQVSLGGEMHLNVVI